MLTLQLHGLGRQRDQPDQEAGFGGTEETKGFDCNTSGTSGGGGGGFDNGDVFPSGVNESAYFAAVLEKPAGGRGSAGGVGREWSSQDEEDGGETGNGSLCEMLGKVARDHGALGVLFEDGLQVCVSACVGIRLCVGRDVCLDLGWGLFLPLLVTRCFVRTPLLRDSAHLSNLTV